MCVTLRRFIQRHLPNYKQCRISPRDGSYRRHMRRLNDGTLVFVKRGIKLAEIAFSPAKTFYHRPQAMDFCRIFSRRAFLTSLAWFFRK